jgi:hypothetical protein
MAASIMNFLSDELRVELFVFCPLIDPLLVFPFVFEFVVWSCWAATSPTPSKTDITTAARIAVAALLLVIVPSMFRCDLL